MTFDPAAGRCLSTEININRPCKRGPPAVHGALAGDRTGWAREDKGKWGPFERPKDVHKLGHHRNISASGVGLGRFDLGGTGSAGSVDVDLVPLKVYVIPYERGGLSGTHASIKQSLDPCAARVCPGDCEKSILLFVGEGAVAAGSAGRLLQRGRGVKENQSGSVSLGKHRPKQNSKLADVIGAHAGLGIQNLLQMDVPNVAQLHEPNGRRNEAAVHGLLPL